ncbi:type I-E CRISPR-associated protein Cas5/CasD [Bowdeniella nasicola]|uniref:Type I-E CRISPR-associated protein Cas5/CasD n=1 Tax=Bowdeniella nasicola TaxID=208480 RepID=A0A1Q5PZ71_9ACTO|nr:type I-E CRISPR-associated protein Cas5/CasD [Bowdeniella nasicola]OKL52914.1 type I-E CRISPR-associated protein Cas5/CasD [Bowdeniella nasicola]
MPTLLLRLKGPQQSWGTDSRFRSRQTGIVPSKSGVLGLLAAAQGRPREADLSDLVGLSFAVRVDQPGSLMVDYHTARAPGAKNPNLSHRHYRADAAFMAAVSGPSDLIQGLSEAIDNPAFPLFLGRRSCPVPWDLNAGVFEDETGADLLRDLGRVPWLAAEWYRRKAPTEVRLPIYRDAHRGEQGDTTADVPLSFDPRHRRYATRHVVVDQPVVVDNELGQAPRDPFFDDVKEA